MRIDEEDVRRIARLAYLELPRVLDGGAWREPAAHLIGPEQLARYARDLSRVLEYVALLDRLPLDQVEGTSHGVPLAPLLRADALEPALPTERALAGAPEAADGGFRVPKVVE